MRLIDIEDTALMKTVADGRLSAKALWRRINAQPTIDAVPVIRCKDCVWRDGSVCLNNNTMPWSDDDFCSNAEKERQ